MSHSFGTNNSEDAVTGVSVTARGIVGESTDQAGVVGTSAKFVGVWGESQSPDQPGVFGKGVLAGRFVGDVEVSGDIRLTGGNDCAEIVRCAPECPMVAGSIAVLDANGLVKECDQAYDRAVAGVISGAGTFRPGLVLGEAEIGGGNALLSLVGRVYCKVDAGYGPISVGDLITTSPTRGHGMAARDRERAFGAVIGKALAKLASGSGLIPILIALH